MQLKAVHYKGIAGASAAPVLGVIVTAIGWFTKNVSTPTANQMCVSGLPLSAVGVVAGLVAVGGSIYGILTLLQAQSTDPKVNIAAGDAAKLAVGQVKP